MSGHSKWSKVKHQKAVTDVVKAQAFTKASRAITVAVREGGGIADPEGNFRLRLAIEKAKEVNMPKDTIVRAIAKGRGVGEEAVESLLYEAIGPGGVAFLIEAATENRQRTVAQVKNVLDHFGGTLTTQGALSFQFSRVGVMVIHRTSNVSDDQIFSQAVEAGATDVQFYDDSIEIYTDPSSFEKVRQRFLADHIAVNNAEIIYRPINELNIDGKNKASIERLTEELENLDDVQRVYSNSTL